MGRPVSAITLAMVNVFPEPVTPNNVCAGVPSLTPSTSCRIASGWSPIGLYSDCKSKIIAWSFGHWSLRSKRYSTFLRRDGVLEAALEKAHERSAIIFAVELELLHGEHEVAQAARAVNLALEFHLHLLATLWKWEVKDVPLVIVELRLVEHIIDCLVVLAIETDAGKLW